MPAPEARPTARARRLRTLRLAVSFASLGILAACLLPLLLSDGLDRGGLVFILLLLLATSLPFAAYVCAVRTVAMSLVTGLALFVATTFPAAYLFLELLADRGTVGLGTAMLAVPLLDLVIVGLALGFDLSARRSRWR